MAAVLHYENRSGQVFQRVWKNNCTNQFTAIIKCFVQKPGEQKMQIIEKPSTRPATFNECCLFARKLKEEYGSNLKQMMIWNVDELKANSSFFK